MYTHTHTSGSVLSPLHPRAAAVLGLGAARGCPAAVMLLTFLLSMVCCYHGLLLPSAVPVFVLITGKTCSSPSLLRRTRVPSDPRASLVDDIDASLLRRYKTDEVTRVLSSWRAMAAGHVHEAELPGFEAEPMLRQQSNSYIDGLPVQLFYEEPSASFAWARALEEQAHVVRDEFLAVLQSDVLAREGNNVWTGRAAAVRRCGPSI